MQTDHFGSEKSCALPPGIAMLNLMARCAFRLRIKKEAVEEYERYLSSGAEAFRRRHLGLMRVSFERPGAAR